MMEIAVCPVGGDDDHTPELALFAFHASPSFFG